MREIGFRRLSLTPELIVSKVCAADGDRVSFLEPQNLYRFYRGGNMPAVPALRSMRTGRVRTLEVVEEQAKRGGRPQTIRERWTSRN
jgi:hypothetical protein